MTVRLANRSSLRSPRSLSSKAIPAELNCWIPSIDLHVIVWIRTASIVFWPVLERTPLNPSVIMYCYAHIVTTWILYLLEFALTRILSEVQIFAIRIEMLWTFVSYWGFNKLCEGILCMVETYGRAQSLVCHERRISCKVWGCKEPVETHHDIWQQHVTWQSLMHSVQSEM